MNDSTHVIDAGARYGMHPTWSAFEGKLHYYAFEPDGEEAERLRSMNKRPDYEVIPIGLSDKPGPRTLYMTKHRGYCSFRELDPDCEWFKRYRPGEGQLESTRQVDTDTVDGFSKKKNISVDFLKVDTEGTEFEVLQGAQEQLRSHVLGVRVNVNFQPCYKGQALFSDIHDFLLERGFFLLNLDYFGRGVPRNLLFRKPDPLSEDSLRYGTLIATDAVWLKEDQALLQLGTEDRPAAVLKYAYFCLLNHAPDVGIDVLMRFVSEENGLFQGPITESQLYKGLRKTCAELLGRWRVYPDSHWEDVRGMFRTIFGLELEAGSRYWELIQSL